MMVSGRKKHTKYSIECFTSIEMINKYGIIRAKYTDKQTDGQTDKEIEHSDRPPFEGVTVEGCHCC